MSASSTAAVSPAAEAKDGDIITSNDAPTDAINVASAKKLPPPEKPEQIRMRSFVLLSFWAIIILLGLPIWWRTTTIYRANLPLDQMMDWADGRACRPVFPLQISIQADTLQDHEAQHLLRTTQHALDDLNDFSAHHLRLQLSPPTNASAHVNGPSTGSVDEEAALIIRLLPGTSMQADLQAYAPILDVYYTPSQVPSSSSSSSSLATYIANTLRTMFAEEQAMIAYLLSTSSAPPERSPKALAPEVAESLAKWTTRSMKYSRTYHLTFSLFTPTDIPSSWNIEAALEEYMKPLLESFSSISNFTIDTQVQLYATPGVGGDVLKKEDLSGFINAAEWPLSPSIGGAPTVNFIVYVGDMEVEGGGKSWLIPQWGGVVIQSDVSDLRPAMLIFSNQLLALLGAPESGSLPLRLMTLVRVRSAGLLLKASGTMGSLARLTLALPSISIPRSVAEGVYTTIEHLRKACDGLGGKEGLENARIAEEAAEKAFFEKSMVGQVYFPDEHKVAVYLPLLGPVGVPLVMSVLKEVKAWRARWRTSSRHAKFSSNSLDLDKGEDEDENERRVQSSTTPHFDRTMSVFGLSILIASVSFLFYRHPPSTWLITQWLSQPFPLSTSTSKKEPLDAPAPPTVIPPQEPSYNNGDGSTEPKTKEELDRKSMPPPPPPFKKPTPLVNRPPSPPTPRASATPTFTLADEDEEPRAPSFPALNSAQRASGGIRGPPRLSAIPNFQPASSPRSTTLMSPPPRTPLPNRTPPSSSSSSFSSSLAPPPSHSSIPTKPRRKVQLTPNHSPLDWARLTSDPSVNLRGLPPSTPYLRVPPSLLRQMTGRKGKDAWTVLGGKVYNMSPYMPYHPGGEPELMKAAGRDGTRLFAEVHPWVNWEGMLEGCLVGFAVDEGEVKSEGKLEEQD